MVTVMVSMAVQINIIKNVEVKEEDHQITTDHLMADIMTDTVPEEVKDQIKIEEVHHLANIMEVT